MARLRLPHPRRGLVVTGLLGVFIGAAALALVRRLFSGGLGRAKGSQRQE